MVGLFKVLLLSVWVELIVAKPSFWEKIGNDIIEPLELTNWGFNNVLLDKV
jgi:hypothetical protein